MQIYLGIGALLFALATFASTLSDSLTDLKDWHDATTPQFVSVVLKQSSSLFFAILGGTLMPQPRRRVSSGSETIETTRSTSE